MPVLLEKKQEMRYWCPRCKVKQLYLEGLGPKLTGIKQGLRSNIEFGNVEVICEVICNIEFGDVEVI